MMISKNQFQFQLTSLNWPLPIDFFELTDHLARVAGAEDGRGGLLGRVAVLRHQRDLARVASLRREVVGAAAVLRVCEE